MADGSDVRIVKGMLAGVIALVLGLMWNERVWVTAPYTEERHELEFTLDGLDLTIEQTEIEESPYRLSVAADTTSVVLPISYPVRPPPVGPVTMNGGTARLQGAVRLADSPVDGAIVRIERFALQGSSEIELTTDQAGDWEVTGLRGGRYRVRAFIPGEYASASSTVLFVDAGSSHAVETPLAVAPVGTTLQFFGPEHVLVGATGTVAVRSVVETVDAEGRLVLSPVPSSFVTASVSGVTTLLSSDAVTGDPEGTARFLVRCDHAGRGVITFETDDGALASFALPPCVVAPPTPPPTAEAVDE